MGSTDGPAVGVVRYHIPDHSVPPEGRSLFAFPAAKEVVDAEVQLHDARDPDVVQGPAGLDSQGFAYINHRSVLDGPDGGRWFEKNNIEDVYVPEVERLVCEVTGAKQAIASNIAFRRRLANRQADPKWYPARDSDIDRELGKAPKDHALIYGREEVGSLEPIKCIHVDYTTAGLKASARYCRKDIAAMAKPALDAEDAEAAGETVEVPRYAAYSVWRPIKTVLRDPITVCDSRSINKKDVDSFCYRALSDVNEDGEYRLEAAVLLPPSRESEHKWCWMPEQKTDDVLIIKFADTSSASDPSVSSGCFHTSVDLRDVEGVEPRNSVEVRVLAFW